MSNSWACVHRQSLGDTSCVAVQWLETWADTRLQEAYSARADIAYDTKYARATPPGPLACAGTLACMVVTADANLHVVYQDPATRAFLTQAAPLCLLPTPVSAAALALYSGVRRVLVVHALVIRLHVRVNDGAGWT